MGKILICRGDAMSISNYLQRNSSSNKCFWLEQKQTNVISWYGVRMLTELCSELQNSNEISPKPLDYFELNYFSNFSTNDFNSKFANICSHLSQNYFLQQPLFNEIKDFVSNLLVDYKVSSIVIPRLSAIDPSSLSLLINVLKNKNIKTALYVGIDSAHDDDWLHEELDLTKNSFDDNGITWEINNSGIKNYIFFMLSLGAEIVECTGVKKPANGVSIKTTIEKEFEDVELYQKLSKGQPLSKLELQQIYLTIKRAFKLYDFRTALNFGLLLFDKGLANYSDEILAELHTMLGLSAHNAHFSSMNANDNTNQFIEKHNLLALEYYKKLGEHKSASLFILYRMAVLYSRRMKQYDEGHKWVKKCILEAKNEPQDIIRNYNLAWVYNICAFIYIRKKDLKNTLLNLEKAIQILENLRESCPESRDVNFSYSVMQDNASAYYGTVNDLPGVKACLINSAKVDGYQKWSACMNNTIWIKLHNKLLRPDLAISDGLCGLNAAREILRAPHQNYFLTSLVFSYFRSNQKKQCLIAIDDSLEFFDKYKSKKQKSVFLTEAISICCYFEEYEKALELSEVLDNISSFLDDHTKIIYGANQSVVLYKNNRSQEAFDLLDVTFNNLENYADNTLSLNVLYIVYDFYKMINHEDQAYLESMLKDQVYADENNDNIYSKLKGMLLFKDSNSGESLEFIISEYPKILAEYSHSWSLLKYFLSDFNGYLLYEKKYLITDFTKILMAASLRDDCKEYLRLIYKEYADLRLDEKVELLISETGLSYSQFISTQFSEEKSKIFEEY